MTKRLTDVDDDAMRRFSRVCVASIPALPYAALSFLASSMTRETMASRRAGFLTATKARWRRNP
jgi:hypothetical protein